MDLSFFRRAQQGFAGRLDVALDYGLLVAMLRAHQDASLAACSEAGHDIDPHVQEPLVELLLGGAQWRQASATQRGCFNPAYARQPDVN
ncbi:hypothetical protein [Sphingosinicella rhizophila]|uniref:Uncharacterized protein n=1 Tax=Sphingosinicella rhizophila TaxID=3050082 RepID=A0ABU3Q569_9SPHN|nr:hypothetical protein [Sphingosinicella sp. GR2756]MDT9598108.1 hypothetical protein [Sphingosinicella sp. GR2756]